MKYNHIQKAKTKGMMQVINRQHKTNCSDERKRKNNIKQIK